MRAWVAAGLNPSEFGRQTYRSYDLIMSGKRLAAERDLYIQKSLVWHGAAFTLNSHAPRHDDWNPPIGAQDAPRDGPPDLSIEHFDRIMGLGE